jgi:coenzyme F420-reducing hydrogenase alpha subunit
MHLLHAPDFLECESAFSLPPEYAGFLEDGMFLKALGNQLLEVIGGRAVHPINVAVGGFHRSPDVVAIRALLSDLERGLEAAHRSLAVVSRFAFPAAPSPQRRLSLISADEYPMNHGDLAISGGAELVHAPIAAFPDYSREFQVRQSTALHSRLIADDSPYLCGPLARLSHNLAQLPDGARQAAEGSGIDWPSASMHQSIIARGIEVIAAIENAIAIVRDYRAPPRPARLELPRRAGNGCHATEAPRGLLYHHYAIDNAGLVIGATIIPPTSQNQAQVEHDLMTILTRELAQPQPPSDASLTRQCETLIRSYDPCISCATHFLTLSISGR